MPRLSILIPALGQHELLESGLVSVLSNRPECAEVVVVVNGHYADPYNLSDEVRFVECRRRAGLVESVNVGLQACRAPVVHLLSCGAEVDEGWTSAALERFDEPKIAAVAPLVLDQEDSDRVLSCGVIYESGGLRRDAFHGRSLDLLAAQPRVCLGPSSWAAFYRLSALLEQTVAFDPAVGDRLADVDLALRLRQAGHQALFEPGTVIRAAAGGRGFSQVGPLQAGWRAERLFWRHAIDGGLTSALCSHLLVVAAELGASFPHPRLFALLAGRMGGCLASSVGNRPGVVAPNISAGKAGVHRIGKHHSTTSAVQEVQMPCEAQLRSSH